MSTVVGICVALLALALGLVLLTEGRELAALLDAFRSLPLLLQAAWSVIVLVSLALLVSAVWLSHLLVRQRRVAQALELRLGGVRDDVKGLVKTQVEAEAAVHQLVRSDPEDAMAAIKRRLAEAESVAQVQHGRNEVGDLQSRVDYIRAQQQALNDRLAPVLEKRRSIEQLFMELHGRQNDLDRALDELASADDAAAIDIGLKNMIEFVKRSHGRCDEIERASKVIAGLNEDYAGLRDRFAPLAATDGGIESRIRELREARDQLTTEIDSLQQTSEGSLTERVRKFADDKKSLEGRLAEMNEEFSKLVTLRKDVAGLFTGFDRALDVLAIGGSGDGAAAVDTRINELTAFIAATQAHLDDIEHRVGIFAQLKTKLAEIQTRLGPLESENGGVVSAVEELKEIRDRLAAKIKRMEESEDGDLAERVRKFTESKRELEQRVAMLNEQFLKLATIRNDIAVLFEKLSSAVSAAAN
ncbi:MAG TPA: hypothetical protein VK430_07630 [Xanthobacteraceae bacterium]|nr:hypothetical protein [Xanthobacteraceae bacterium]